MQFYINHMSHLKRTRLRDKFLKDRSDYNKKEYSKQRK